MLNSFDDDLPDILPKKRTAPMRYIRATNLKGEDVSIPILDQLPSYVDFAPIPKETPFIPVQPPEEHIDHTLNGKTFPVPLFEKYAPKRYQDLISDEKSNRDVLNWLRRFSQNTMKTTKKTKKTQRISKKKKAEVIAADAGPIATSTSNVLILSGPSGSGKSSLLQIVANRCDYHIIELNASEDANTERNQILLNNQLDFQPCFGKKTRPLLVIEEADGATITDSVLHAISRYEGRPIILVVNDLYAPVFRTIRQTAFKIKLPEPKKDVLQSRIQFICEQEKISITPKAIQLIISRSRSDIRTILNTLQFLAVTSEVIVPEMVTLLPIGAKNTNLGPFDVYESLFSSTTKVEDMMDILETYSNPTITSFGILENIEHIKTHDLTHYKMVEMLDLLSLVDSFSYQNSMYLSCFSKCPSLCGISKLSKYQLTFPSNSTGCEAAIKKTSTLLSKQPAIRSALELLPVFLSPPQDIETAIIKTNGPLREAAVSFHKKVNIKYKKDALGRYLSEPDVDGLIGFGKENIAALTKFRETIQHEIEKEQAFLKQLKEKRHSSQGGRIGDRLHGLKAKKGKSRNFWGEETDIFSQSQLSQSQKEHLVYHYNEGFTNAVRRKVSLNRILLKDDM